MIDRFNAVAARARAAGAPVVFVQPETGAGAFAHGSAGWQLAPGLCVDSGDLFVRKTTPDAFERTPLKAKLDARGITELAICGLQSAFCVDTTTRRAAALGYPVVLVPDAHTTTDKPHLAAPAISAHHNPTLSNITSSGPRIRAVPAVEMVFGA